MSSPVYACQYHDAVEEILNYILNVCPYSLSMIQH